MTTDDGTMESLSMLDLLEEGRYWARLLREADDRGQEGRSFARCLGSVRAEIQARREECGCDSCQEDAS